MPTNYQTVLLLRSLILRPLQWMGLVPLSLSVKRGRFHQSEWRLLGTVLVFLVVILMAVPYYYLLNSAPFFKSVFSLALQTVQIGLNYLLLIVSYATILVNPKELEYVLNSFAELFSMSCSELRYVDGPLLKRFLRKIILIDYILFTISFALFIPFGVGPDPILLSSWLANAASVAIQAMICNLFQILIITASTIYWSINRKVSRVVDTLSKFDEHEAFWSRNRRVMSKICLRLVREINELCYLHRKTAETVQRMTQFFCVPMMFVSLFHFLAVISEMYFDLIEILTAIQSGYHVNFGQLVSSFMFMLMSSLQFYYSTSVCSQLTQRAEETAIILNEFFLTDVDQCVNLSINMFTLEMLHHDYRVQMCGCFSMDFVLAHSAVATMTSYLIIVVQFGLSKY